MGERARFARMQVGRLEATIVQASGGQLGAMGYKGRLAVLSSVQLAQVGC